MKIAVDLDGTVFQTYEKAVERYRKETGKEFHLKDFALNKDKIDDWFQEYFLSEREENKKRLADLFAGSSKKVAME